MRAIIFAIIICFNSNQIYSDNEFPWEDISKVRIKITITRNGREPLIQKDISPACNSDSSFICNLMEFKMSSYDRDVCFWSDFISNANPIKHEYRYKSGFGCMAPIEKYITIDITNAKGKTYELSIDNYTGFNKLELEGGKDCWEIYLNELQVQKLIERILSIMNCGQNNLNELIYSDKLFPK